MGFPLPPGQLRNFTGGWFQMLFTFLSGLVGGINARTQFISLIIGNATPATNPLPARNTALPTPPSTPSYFLTQPVGNLTGATSYTLQVGGAYKPGDIVNIFFTKAQLAGQNVTVIDGGAGTPTAGVILNANVGASGFGYIEMQLNTSGAHWLPIGGGTV